MIRLFERPVLRRHALHHLPAMSVPAVSSTTTATAAVASASIAARCFSSTHSAAAAGSNSGAVPNNYRSGMEKEIEALAETKARNDLSAFLKSSATPGLAHGPTGRVSTANPFHHDVPTPPPDGYRHLMSPDQIRTTLDAAMATFQLHVESRIAALCGRGFYTIGPCGEELLSAAGHALDPETDAVALHYRHLGVSLTRQLRQGRDMEDILLDRARGYCVSRNDPVTGGVHCAIGSRVSDRDLEIGSGDYVVTSTLASQCPPAVGRALGFSVASKLLPQAEDKSSSRPISFVTIGDGSMHNAHFLSAFNLARHARFRRIKCPVVFGITDNGISISYKTDGYTRSLFNLRGDEIPMWAANGTDMLDVYDKTLRATEYSRKKAAPSLLLYKDITRRFGHAATDRQFAYLTEDEILGMAESDVISSAVVQAVEQQNVGTYAEWADRFEEIGVAASRAFDAASLEPKITDRDDMMSVVSQPMVQVPRLPQDKVTESVDRKNESGPKNNNNKKAEVMRKHMTKVLAETLDKYPDVVYLGEDVEHGGYYLVSDGLAKKYPGRVIDFPPDETTLLGAAMGYSQAGLTPIVEIPYAKYLDCGVDTFYELAISNWLTNGQRPNGMIVRVQGFDRGVFGGNFHTHNMLSHMPPGVDVVCFSNGRDYVRGFRNAIEQARVGRVVVFIDCTNLLNLRHLRDKDRRWETLYPPDDVCEIMGFDDVRTYTSSLPEDRMNARFAIVTYGNGVVTSLQARASVVDKGLVHEDEVDVIDCPYLSGIPKGLKEVIGCYDGVLFADICKEGPGSNALSPMIPQLKKDDVLPSNWDFVAAPRTYNPLGSMITFLNEEDVVEGLSRVIFRADELGGSHEVALKTMG